MEGSNGRLQRTDGGCRCKIRVVGQKDGLWRQREKTHLMLREKEAAEKQSMRCKLSYGHLLPIATLSLNIYFGL